VKAIVGNLNPLTVRGAPRTAGEAAKTAFQVRDLGRVQISSMAHREQRGAGVNKTWCGVRRIGGDLNGVSRVGAWLHAHASIHGRASAWLCRCKNIVHRSDLVSLCVLTKDAQ